MKIDFHLYHIFYAEMNNNQDNFHHHQHMNCRIWWVAMIISFRIKLVSSTVLKICFFFIHWILVVICVAIKRSMMIGSCNRDSLGYTFGTFLPLLVRCYCPWYRIQQVLLEVLRTYFVVLSPILLSFLEIPWKPSPAPQSHSLRQHVCCLYLLSLVLSKAKPRSDINWCRTNNVVRIDFTNQ